MRAQTHTNASDRLRSLAFVCPVPSSWKISANRPGHHPGAIHNVECTTLRRKVQTAMLTYRSPQSIAVDPALLTSLIYALCDLGYTPHPGRATPELTRLVWGGRLLVTYRSGTLLAQGTHWHAAIADAQRTARQIGGVR